MLSGTLRDIKRDERVVIAFPFGAVAKRSPRYYTLINLGVLDLTYCECGISTNVFDRRAMIDLRLLFSVGTS